jgi:hypothetical protein
MGYVLLDTRIWSEFGLGNGNREAPSGPSTRAVKIKYLRSATFYSIELILGLVTRGAISPAICNVSLLLRDVNLVNSVFITF